MPIHRAPLPGTLDAPFATAQPPAGLLPDDPPSYDWLAEIARALRTGDRSVGSDDPGPAAQAG
ncbi:MAG TPA: hypothetical protein VFQ95_02735 [Rhodanobacteraceae bacterium]|nr:hypothetical protein [Rhodanobacteraceae bacterium]